MSTLSVWRFSTPHGADAVEYTVRQLEQAGQIQVHDAAVVSWEHGAKRPQTRRLGSTDKHDTLTGSFWGLVLGLVFFVPLLGVAVGAAVGKVHGSLREVGIDDDFVETVRREVVPGTSAIFLLTSKADVHAVVQAFKGHEHDLISTNLSKDQETWLRRLLDEADEARPSAAGS